jgi:hypothetical protein
MINNQARNMMFAEQDEEQPPRRLLGIAGLAARAALVVGLGAGVGLGLTSVANAAEPARAVSVLPAGGCLIRRLPGMGSACVGGNVARAFGWGTRPTTHVVHCVGGGTLGAVDLGAVGFSVGGPWGAAGGAVAGGPLGCATAW